MEDNDNIKIRNTTEQKKLSDVTPQFMRFTSNTSLQINLYRKSNPSIMLNFLKKYISTEQQEKKPQQKKSQQTKSEGKMLPMGIAWPMSKVC